MNTIKNNQAEPQGKIPVLLFEDSISAQSDLKQTLSQLDYQILEQINEADNLSARRQQIDADILIIKIPFPTPKILEQLNTIKQLAPLPVIIIAEQDNASSIQESLKAGVSAYVLNEIKPRRLKSIITAACENFKERHSPQSELEQTKTQLKNRKLLERAKRFIMQQKKISEQEALNMLTKMAMNNGHSLARAATNVVEVCQLLKQHHI
ncbi:ANTAR domain-containing response regulator [Psychromonas antarctica]|jgi:response regulator NasT|uniref:ANTAR domain-containing response regulator n=1 Tax=Psychromonas antarctica TaxID=67573 RepID=UPI001EE81559|nr:ANTAR domain-containing protein [Psychromonas antarctica]MCG6200800.1 ANTAR domain-containing protein [Psychromonas antarctica]